MSESAEIIARLVASGVNYESIGQAVGRNRSLIRQVNIGAKPGNNLRDALSALEDRLAGKGGQAANRAARAAVVPSPARRTTGRGSLARVRKPTTITGRTGWTSSVVKKSGARSGARGLGHSIADAADEGRALGVTVTVDKSVSVVTAGSSGKSRRGRSGPGGSAEWQIEDSAEAWNLINAEYGGNVSAYLADEMLAAGYVSGIGADDLAAHLAEIEIRTW